MTSSLILLVAIVLADGQYFGFGRGPAQLAQPAFGGYGNCVPYPNYQSHGKNFWISWRGDFC
jgi:hypothetical protein